MTLIPRCALLGERVGIEIGMGARQSSGPSGEGLLVDLNPGVVPWAMLAGSRPHGRGVSAICVPNFHKFELTSTAKIGAFFIDDLVSCDLFTVPFPQVNSFPKG